VFHANILWLRGWLNPINSDGQNDFFIQLMYDMDFMTATADRNQPVNKP
jgi:hypothetical protein